MKRYHHDMAMTQAWFTAALNRNKTKRMPSLEKLLSKQDKGPQTVGQLKSQIAVIAAHTGTKMRKANRT